MNEQQSQIKFVAQSRPALYYSQKQVYRIRWNLETSAKLRVFGWIYRRRV